MFEATTKLVQIQHKPGRRGRTANKPWEVIHDPSGDFSGRLFRSFTLTGAAKNYWPEGIVFKNTKTGEIKTWTDGKFVSTKETDRV